MCSDASLLLVTSVLETSSNARPMGENTLLVDARHERQRRDGDLTIPRALKPRPTTLRSRSNTMSLLTGDAIGIE